MILKYCVEMFKDPPEDCWQEFNENLKINNVEAVIEA